MRRLSAAIVRLRFLIVAFWVAATIAAVTQLPTIEQAGGGGIGSLVPEEAEAIRAERQSKTLFAFPLLSRTVVIVQASDTLTREGRRELIELAGAITRGGVDPELRGLAAAAPLIDRVLSTDGPSTTALNYLFFPLDVSRSRQLELVSDLPADGFVDGYGEPRNQLYVNRGVGFQRGPRSPQLPSRADGLHGTKLGGDRPPLDPRRPRRPPAREPVPRVRARLVRVFRRRGRPRWRPLEPPPRRR